LVIVFRTHASGQWTWAKIPPGKNCHVDVRGKYADGRSADVSNVDICADKTVDLSTDARETAPIKSDARPSRWSRSCGQIAPSGGVLAIASNAAIAMRIIPGLGFGLVVLRRLCGSLTQVPPILADAELAFEIEAG
jgi:hypothetical protein